MSDVTPPPFPETPAPEATAAAAPPPPAPAAAAPVAPAPVAYGAPVPAAPAGGQIGQVRGTGISIVLAIVTLGIYQIVWYAKVHGEMKRYSGQGIGGGLAAILALFVSIAMIFVTPSEVGGLYERAGREKPVSGVTGFWMLLPLVGAIVWFVKVNGALNDYWKSLGAS